MSTVMVLTIAIILMCIICIALWIELGAWKERHKQKSNRIKLLEEEKFKSNEVLKRVDIPVIVPRVDWGFTFMEYSPLGLSGGTTEVLQDTLQSFILDVSETYSSSDSEFPYFEIHKKFLPYEFIFSSDPEASGYVSDKVTAIGNIFYENKNDLKKYALVTKLTYLSPLVDGPVDPLKAISRKEFFENIAKGEPSPITFLISLVELPHGRENEIISNPEELGKLKALKYLSYTFTFWSLSEYIKNNSNP